MRSTIKVAVDLISDIDMYLFFEKVMRGGVSFISKRYNKVNDKSLTSYDQKEQTKYITCLDKNNLYNYAISKYLPMGGFKWLDNAKFSLDKYDNKRSSRSSVLEVNLEYPKELQKLHNDHPLAPDKLEIKEEMLSDYQLKITDDCSIPISYVKK